MCQPGRRCSSDRADARCFENLAGVPEHQAEFELPGRFIRKISDQLVERISQYLPQSVQFIIGLLRKAPCRAPSPKSGTRP
jgi:hypothetical protein